MRASLAPGVLIAGDYEIVRPLGEGGMGAVYEVVQRSTGHRRALKLMLSDLVPDDDARGRFEREARVASRIPSEHVVEVTAAGVDDGRPYIVMELLSGMDLGALVGTRGALPRAEVREIFSQIAHALAAAHRAGVVHRDLKPENVFVARSMHAGSETTVKVLDFGIAKLLELDTTKRTAAMGTPLWMSPEQADRGVITPAADVWALGLIAFHLLTGFHFWRCTDAGEPTLTALLRDLLIDPIPSASERAAMRGAARLLPAGFDAFLARCVVRDPAQRHPDAAAMWAALEPILRSEALAHSATALQPSSPRSAPTPPGPRASRSRAPIALAAIGASIATAIAVIAWWKASAPEPATTAPRASEAAATIVPPVASPPVASSPASVAPAPSAPPTTVRARAPRRPIVGGGVPAVLSGAVSERDIKSGLIAQTSRFDACYASALAKKPDLHGTLNLRVQLSDAGWVKGVTRQPDSELDDAGLVACITAALEQSNWGNTVPSVILFPFEFHLE